MQFLCVEETKIAVESLLSNSAQRLANFSSTDSLIISACRVQAIPNPTTSRLWQPLAPADGTFRAAIGKVTQPPIAGTFTVGFGSQTSGVLVVGHRYLIATFVALDDFTNVGAGSNATGVTFTASGTTPTNWTHSSVLIEITTALAYNASISALQTALNALASISALSPPGVVVTSVAGDYVITFNATGNQPQITAYATNLAPQGTIGEVGTVLAGDAGISEVQTLRFVQSPAAYVDLADESPAAQGTVTATTVGGGGANAVYEVLTFTIEADGSVLNAPYDGRFSLSVGGAESELISFDATAVQVAEALGRMSSVGPGVDGVPNVSVFKSAPGIYTIGFQGEKANVNMGTMTINASALLVVPFMTGVLDLANPSIQLLFGTATTVACVFVIEYTPAGGLSYEIFRLNVTLVQALIAQGSLIPSPVILFWTSVQTQAAIDAAIAAITGSFETMTLTGGVPSTDYLTGTLIVDGGVGISGDTYTNGLVNSAGFQLYDTNQLGREYVDPHWQWVSNVGIHAPRILADVLYAGASNHAFFNLSAAGGFPPTALDELLLQNTSPDGGDTFSIRNTNPTGYSSVTFRDSANVESFAVGHGNPSESVGIFANANYLETFNGSGAPPVFRICADGDYGATGSGYRFYQRLSVETTGVVKLWKLIPWGSSQVELVTFADTLVTVAAALTATGAVTASSTLTSTGAFTASSTATITGAFTANGTATFNSAVTMSPAATVAISPSTLIINPTTGAINGVTLGQATPAAASATTLSASGLASLLGGLRLTYSQKTATYSFAATDYAIEATANTFTLTLPTASGRIGQPFLAANSGSGVITLSTTGGQTINGLSTLSLSQGTAFQVTSNGSNWVITGSYGGASAGSFTTLTASGATTFTAGTASSSTTTGTVVITGGVGVSGSVIAGALVSAVGDLISTGGNAVVSTAGKGLTIKAGTSGRLGTQALTGGTATVTCTNITTSTRIFLQRVTAGGTLGAGGYGYTISAGASFTINSVDLSGVLSVLDTSTVGYFLVEQT